MESVSWNAPAYANSVSDGTTRSAIRISADGRDNRSTLASVALGAERCGQELLLAYLWSERGDELEFAVDDRYLVRRVGCPLAAFLQRQLAGAHKGDPLNRR